MKKWFAIAMVLLLSMAVVGSVSATEKATERVPICHNAGDQQWVLISPDNSGWNGHFENMGAHGDVFAVGGECPEVEVQGEQCGRCSNIADFTWVDWYDRDGGCDDDFQNERVETYPSEACGAIYGCMDETAWNFDPDANFPDRSCVYDVCPNLEGLQETIPDGYVKPGKRCIPKPVPGPGEPSVEFRQGCVDGVPVVGITFSGVDGDSLSITGNGRDLSYAPGVYREKMRPYDSYAWLISRGERGVERGKLLVEVCPVDPTPTPPPKKPPETGGGDVGMVLVGVMAGTGLVALGLGINGLRKGKKEE